MNIDFLSEIENLYLRRFLIMLLFVGFSVVFLIVGILEVIRDVVVDSFKYVWDFVPKAKDIYIERIFKAFNDYW